MRIQTVPKQVGARIYANGCVTLSTTIRNQHGLRDGDSVMLWVETFDRLHQERLGEGIVRARLTSGGEIYISREIVGARPGHLVDLVLLRP